MSCASVVLVGPKEIEIDRLVDLAHSLAAHKTGPGWFVMVDDSPIPRHLDRLVTLPSNIIPVALHHQRPHPILPFRHGGGLCSCVLLAMQWVRANTDARMLLKLDTDSLIIGPFEERLYRILDANPVLGMAGAHTLTPNGDKRLWEFHAATIKRLLKPPFDWRRPLSRFRGNVTDPTAEHVSRMIRNALANGYDPGEHCLGGGYVLSSTLLDRMAEAGYLNDPYLWIDVDLAEDVMVAAHVRAVGMTLDNHVGQGEVFGVRYQGLPELPAQLLERGYGVIHSVKNDPRVDEPTIREFFRKHRAA
jgi:hypothetical protein